MATDRQIEANRKNAQHCTGPRTEKGRATSSENALKTGIDAKSEVLRFESRPDYEALIAELYARYHPTVPEDRALVDMLIRSEWFLRRYTAIDTAVWEHDFYENNETSLGATYRRTEQVLDRVGRRLNWAHRSYQSALKQLLEIRARRAAEPEPVETPEPEAQPERASETTETAPENQKLVSFLQPAPQPETAARNQLETSPEPEENPPTAA